MFKAFNAFITTLFTALNSFALALNHVAGWTEETAGAFADEARVNRQAQLNSLNTALKLTTSVAP